MNGRHNFRVFSGSLTYYGAILAGSGGISSFSSLVSQHVTGHVT